MYEQYVAVYGYSFDPDKHACLFTSFEEACEWIESLADEELQVNKESYEDGDVNIEIEKDKESGEIRIVVSGTDASGNEFQDIEWYLVSEISEEQ